MKIQIGKYAGFCMGVRRAVNMVLEASRQGGSIYTLGPLIHNPQVMNMLVRKGVKILDDIPKIGPGTVVIRAHGVHPRVKVQLRNAGFDIIDATCPRVAKIQNLIRTYTAKGYTVIIIGDRTHPEVIGLLGYAGDNGYVVGALSELEDLPEFEHAIIVAQSTQDTAFYDQVRQWAGERYPHYKVFDTICDSTERRQAEVRRLSKDVDLMVVVGGRDSANTKRLYDIAIKTGKPAFHIETEKDLELLNRDILASAKKVGITAGASTPNWMIQNVYVKLKAIGDSGMKNDNGGGYYDRKENRERENKLLQGVSRSFALTIPQLPDVLRERVTIAYLLCRIADTIEDEETLSTEAKRIFFEEFTSLLNGKRPIGAFVDRLLPLLSDSTLPAEKELIADTPIVLDAFFRFSKKQQAVIAKCIRIMSAGMLRFQETKSLHGLPTLSDMSDYCYHVAGVVGEMLTELFCDYSNEIAKNRDRLLELAPSFGQALQMTNILKDIWEDLDRGACWLPRDVFARAGFDLRDMNKAAYTPQFGEGLVQLVAIAHGHLQDALEYTLLIPKHESGIRKFCLWAIGMAVFTLRNIYSIRHYSSGNDVKISRRTVKGIILVTRIGLRNNSILKAAYRIATYGLPIHHEGAVSDRSLWNRPSDSDLFWQLYPRRGTTVPRKT